MAGKAAERRTSQPHIVAYLQQRRIVQCREAGCTSGSAMGAKVMAPRLLAAPCDVQPLPPVPCLPQKTVLHAHKLALRLHNQAQMGTRTKY